MKITTNLIHVVFVLAALLLLSTCSKPERDNPWDEKSTLNPEAWAPKNFQVEKLTITSNRLSWTYEGDNRIEGFRIDRKKGEEGWHVSIASLQKNIRSWVDENVEPNITYTYRIYTFAGDKLSKEESISSITDFAAPSNLRITASSFISATLEWDDNSNFEEGFKVERKQDNGNWQVLAQLTANVTSYTDNSIDLLEYDYSYRVFALYQGNGSSVSNIVNALRMVITETAYGINMTLIRIDGGSFQMGSNEYNSNEQPVHSVTLSTFYLGKFEVTQAQWRAVMGTSPSYFSGCDDCPVEQVSWDDAHAFIQKLNQASGRNYALPTEAQWEYAAGGGATNRTKWAGTNDENSLGNYAWFLGNSNSQTHPVGTKNPNALGLYEMSGNVWEWCEDDWHDGYQGAPADGGAWIDSPRGSYRVLRGGSWNHDPSYCRAAIRIGSSPGNRAYSLGFRVVLAP